MHRLIAYMPNGASFFILGQKVSFHGLCSFFLEQLEYTMTPPTLQASVTQGTYRDLTYVIPSQPTSIAPMAA
jgi:hypothetical protein